MSFARWLHLLGIAIRPTRHPPRSPGKMRVFRLRARYQLPLHVTGDAKLPDELALPGAGKSLFQL